MHLFQLPEDDRPRLEAIAYLLALRATSSPVVAFGKLQLASHGAVLAEKHEEFDLTEQFQEVIASTSEYVDEEFIGARYRHRESGRERLILDVVNLDLRRELRRCGQPRYRIHSVMSK